MTEVQENTTKNYELAFHLTPDLNDDEAKKEAVLIEDMVKKTGGMVVFFKEPARTRLSYPIKQKGAGYFSFINFSSGPEAIEKINGDMKTQNNVLRHMIIQRNPLQEKKLFSSQPPITHKATVRPKEESAKPEDIEKELTE